MTAEEKLKEVFLLSRFADYPHHSTFDATISAMQNYAKEKCQELLEIVAEKVKIIEDNDEQYEQYYLDLGGVLKVDKTSILKAVNLDEFIN